MLPLHHPVQRPRIVAASVAAGAALSVLLVTPAIASTTVKKGNETASLAVTVVALPGATKASRGSRLRYVVKLGTVNGQRSSEDLRTITVSGPSGLRYNSNIAPLCDVARLFAEETYQCRKASVLGTGKGKADARPAVPKLIDAKLTAYTALINVDANDMPKTSGLPGVLIDATLSPTSSIGIPLDTKPNGTFIYKQAKPATGKRAPYTLVDLDLTVGILGRNGTSFIQLPKTCPKNGKWRFTMVVRNWSGLTLTATHNVRCKR